MSAPTLHQPSKFLLPQPGRPQMTLDYANSYFPGYDGRIERNVISIPKDQLKRMWSGRQLDPSFRLATSEVKVVFVVWDRLVNSKFFIDIDEQVMVARVGYLSPECVTPIFRRPKRHQNAPLIRSPSVGQMKYR